MRNPSPDGPAHRAVTEVVVRRDRELVGAGLEVLEPRDQDAATDADRLSG